MPSFETPEPIVATIEVVLGDVLVNADARATTTVDVRPSDPANAEDVKAAERTRVEYIDRRLVVKAPKPRSWMSRGTRGGSVDVTIELPAGSSVHGTTGLADVVCDGLLADCRIKTGLGDIRVGEAGTLNLKSGAGDISVQHATRHAELTSGSGDISARELDESAVVKSSNGDVRLGVVRGDLRVTAANGVIAVDSAQGSVVAKASNGDVRIGEVVRGTVVAETAIGDVEVGIREGAAAYLDVNATAGRVYNALTASDAPGASDDKVEVRARTSVGDVAIRRP
jgi:Putative adhesin